MPAPRTCRDCGAVLSPDLRWCQQCLAPVTEFAPRAIAPGRYVETPRPDVRYSRWHGGPTSFGPVGRILATILVFLFGPWTNSGIAIVYAPFWIVAAVVALKAIWKKERVAEDRVPSATELWRIRHELRHPAMFKQITRKWAVVSALAIGAVGYVYMLMRMASQWRSLIGLVIACIVIGLFLAWMGEV